MILRVAPGGIVLLLALVGSVGGQDDDSLASTFLSGKNHDWRLTEALHERQKYCVILYSKFVEEEIYQEIYQFITGEIQ